MVIPSLNNADDSNSDSEVSEDDQDIDSGAAPENDIIADLGTKLQDLAIRFSTDPPAISSSIQAFNQHLDVIIAHLDTTRPRILPSKKKLPPNQNSWTETASVMNVPIKTKRKKHTDPYGGGERPGKKAKADASAAAGRRENFSCVIIFILVFQGIINNSNFDNTSDSNLIATTSRLPLNAPTPSPSDHDNSTQAQTVPYYIPHVYYR